MTRLDVVDGFLRKHLGRDSVGFVCLDSSLGLRCKKLVPTWRVIVRCRGLVLLSVEILLLLALEDLGKDKYR